MRFWSGLGCALLGLASLARAQRFGLTHQMLPADVDDTQALALGDVDGDGDLDAFFGIYPQIRLYLDDGTGTFTDVTPTNLPALIASTRAVALGDVDGDGDLDAFMGNVGQDRLYVNDGMGVFTDVTATNLSAFLDNTWAVALGDVDGDGDLDAFVGNGDLASSVQQNRLHLNDGTGTFTDVTGTNLPALVDSTRAVALGDVDGDGDLDAFVGNSGGQNRLYLNGGTGVFVDVTVTNLPALVDSTRAVALGDVDGDGDLDALAGPSHLYLNDGTGTFADLGSTNLPGLFYNPSAIALGDVDGDGDLDALLGQSVALATSSYLFLNNGAGVFTDVTATSLPASVSLTGAVALGDVDGDGDLDAFVGNLFPHQDRLYLNLGTGVFTDVTAATLPPQFDQTLAIALGDVDGDGDLDALAGNFGQSRLHLNSGTGVFTDVTATSLPISIAPATAVVFGDVDGDGDLDAFVGNFGQSTLYLNGGLGAFTDVTATNLPALSDLTQAVALGDVDGDGDLDAFAGTVPGFYPGSGHNHLFLNDGTGVFTDVPASNLSAPVEFTTAVALADVDGDGDLDAFVGNYQQQNRLYLNGGIGDFADVTATNLPTLVDDTRGVAVGDVDGDGDLDAFVGNGGQNRLLLNVGAGVFTDVSAAYIPVLLDNTYAVVLGDVEGDGDLDAFVGNNVGQNRLYRNDGTGVFTDVTATSLTTPPDHTAALALGDLDLDGDLDVIAGNTLGGLGSLNRVYVNLSRQLAWRGIPRVGKPLVLDLWGPPSGAWLLAASLGSANIPLAPFGTLRLDSATLWLVAAGALDPQGRASVSLLVPSIPALVGIPVYWQAGVAPPALLTNLEITTATSL